MLEIEFCQLSFFVVSVVMFAKLTSIVKLDHLFKLLSNYSWNQVGLAFIKKTKKSNNV